MDRTKNTASLNINYRDSRIFNSGKMKNTLTSRDNFSSVLSNNIKSKIIDSDFYSIFNRLPINNINGLGFEYNNYKNSDLVDFFIPIDIDKNINTVLESSPLNKSSNAPLWGKIYTLADMLLYHNTNTCSQIDELWLEFDRVVSRADVSIPSLFFINTPQAFLDINIKRSFFTFLKNDIIPLFHPDALSQNSIKILLDCLLKLPQSAQMNNIGIPITREPFALRLFSTISTSDIFHYLDAIKWFGNLHTLHIMLDQLKPMVKNLYFDIDITDRIEPRIGIEIFLDTVIINRNRMSWSPILHYLITLNLLQQEQYDTLSNFQGHKVTICDSHKEDQNTFTGNMNKALLDIFDWGIHHCKLSIESDETLKAKIYLYCKHFLMESKCDKHALLI